MNICGKLSQKCDELKIDWTIENIFSGDKAKYWSPTFVFMDSHWYLFSRHRQQKNGDISISLFLYKFKDDKKTPVGVIFVLGVKKADGTFDKKTEDITWIFTNDDGVCGRHSLLMKSDLLRRKSELAPSDALTMSCILRANPNISRLEKFSESVKRKFASLEDCDVSLNVQNKKFAAHKDVLAAQSPVFAAMFASGMKERSTGTVDIVDIEPDAFKDFLEFIYSGNFDKDTSDVFQLYKIADKYDVSELKSACTLSIQSRLSVENICQIALQSCELNDSNLDTQIQSIFNENFGQIIKTDSWMSLLSENPAFGNSLLKRIAASAKMKK